MRRRLVPQVLSRYPPSFLPISPVQSLNGAGGLSGGTLWRFKSARGAMVLRLWPQVQPDRGHLQRVHAWLDLASDLGFLAVPIRSLEGTTLVEVNNLLWQVEPFMPGTADIAEPPATEHLEAAITGLACLHRRLAGTAAAGLSPGINSSVRVLERLLGGGIGEIETALGDLQDDGLKEGGKRWVELARLVVPRSLPQLRDAARLQVPLQPCLRDARPEHFLFQGPHLSGVVDFGAMGIETVAADLARLTGEWLGGDRPLRDEAIAIYERERPLETSERHLISMFDMAADLLIGANWLRWNLIEHRRFEDPDASLKGIQRGIARMLRRIEFQTGACIQR